MSHPEASTTTGDTGQEPKEVFDVLSDELRAYYEMQPDLVESNIGHWALIKGDVVVVCPEDTQNGALSAGRDEFGEVPFLAVKLQPRGRRKAPTFLTPNLGL